LVRMKRKGRLLLVLGLVFLVQAGGIAWSQVTERVSVDSAGVEGNNASTAPSTSSDGRYVAFESLASDLVAGDTNGDADVFVRDLQTGATTRVSVDSAEVQGIGDSNFPSISGDGLHVAFESDADLGGGDANPFSDIFVRDLLAGTTILVSVDSAGFQDIGFSVSPSISSNGRYVAFESDGNLVFDDTGVAPDIFVHDRDADDDGIYDDENGILDAGEVSTVRVSVRSDGTEADQNSSAPSISADGRYVAFESFAANLVAGDLNGLFDVFVHDRDADGDGIYDDEDGTYDAGEVSTVRVSVDSAGTEGNAGSRVPSISADGRYVAFESDASNLVAGDMPLPIGFIDIFVHDRDADGDGIYDDEDGTYDAGEVSTVRVSVDSAGTEGNGQSYAPSISADGRYVVFYSEANNLVDDDNNGSADVFVHDLQTETTTRVSVNSVGDEGNDTSSDSSISANGNYVVFESAASNLVAGDMPLPIGFIDIFVHELQAGTGQSGSGGSSSGGSGCFIATAAFESRMAGEK
jgi:Tol biopolymer transport system component